MKEQALIILSYRSSGGPGPLIGRSIGITVMLAVRIALFVAAGLCALAVASGPDYEKGKLLSFNSIQFSSI